MVPYLWNTVYNAMSRCKQDGLVYVHNFYENRHCPPLYDQPEAETAEWPHLCRRPDGQCGYNTTSLTRCCRTVSYALSWHFRTDSIMLKCCCLRILCRPVLSVMTEKKTTVLQWCSMMFASLIWRLRLARLYYCNAKHQPWLVSRQISVDVSLCSSR